MRNKLGIGFVLCLLWNSCQLGEPNKRGMRSPIFNEYHSALDSIIISDQHLVRQCELGTALDSIKKNENLFHATLIDNSDTNLYYEYLKQDSTFNIKMNYSFQNKQLSEAELLIQHKDYNQMQMIYFNTILFYTKKLGEPLKDKGFFIFKQKKEAHYNVLAITDESDNLHNIMRLQLYKEF